MRDLVKEWWGAAPYTGDIYCAVEDFWERLKRKATTVDHQLALAVLQEESGAFPQLLDRLLEEGVLNVEDAKEKKQREINHPFLKALGAIHNLAGACEVSENRSTEASDEYFRARTIINELKRLLGVKEMSK